MKLTGQRWEYRIGNTTVFADNAFNLPFWGQERFIVNGEVIRSSSGLFRIRATLKEPWLTHVGESELEVDIVSRAMGISCSAWLDGEPVEPEAVYVAQWQGGRNDWPEESFWSAEGPLRWVVNAKAVAKPAPRR